MNNIVNEQDIKHLLKKDAVFEMIHALYGPPPDWQRPEGFISLARIILEQQVSLQSANAHFNKLNAYIPAFAPEEIIKLSDQEMRNCQISKQKSKYLRELSSALLLGKIDPAKFRKQPVEEIRNQLKSIKGIGDWTCDIYLMFCLQEKDIFPTGDIALINTIKQLSLANNADEIKTYTERWKPFRSLASYFLWHYYLRERNR